MIAGGNVTLELSYGVSDIAREFLVSTLAQLNPPRRMRICTYRSHRGAWLRGECALYRDTEDVGRRRRWVVDVTLHPPHPCTGFRVVVPVGSVSVDRATQVLMGVPRCFAYEYQEVVFADFSEMVIFGVGYYVFKALRKMKLIPGRISRTGAARYAIELLERFRKSL